MGHLTKKVKNLFRYRKNDFLYQKAPLYPVSVRKQQKWCRIERKTVFTVYIIIRYKIN